MQYRAFEPDIEILGAAMFATVDGFGPFRSIIERLLHRAELAVERANGEIHIDLDRWYPQQRWLDALHEVEERFGCHVMFKIGSAIPNNAVFPPEITEIHGGIASIDVAYHLNHRKRGQVMFNPERGTMIEGIGHYGYERISDTCIRSRCVTPYPCQFDFGIVTAMARRFQPEAQVSHVGDGCRRRGGDECEYEVSWA